MTVIDVQKDTTALTLTFVAEFDAPVERVWQLWADPRKLERWWGPPEWPATFTRHELQEGGTVEYHMTGPDGTKAAGWWTVTAMDAPRTLAFDDGFADDDGRPHPDMPVTRIVMTLEPQGEGRTRQRLVSTFPSREALEELVAMGMEEGMRLAMGQADAILAEA